MNTPVLLLVAFGAAMQCLGVQPVQAFLSVPLGGVVLPLEGRGIGRGLQAARFGGVSVVSSHRAAAVVCTRVQMQLGFPRQRREVQQSREYNVAKVRGGYYMSDKEGEAPLEEVITSKLADCASDDDVTEADTAGARRWGQGLNDEDFAVFVSRQAADAAEDTPPSKYMPSLKRDDPIIKEIYRLELASRVISFELLDSRWNGNEVLQYITDKGSFFVKINRVEDSSVFLAEAAGLTSILRTDTVAVPKPLHVGKLPKVGLFGPGAFLIAGVSFLFFGSCQKQASCFCEVLRSEHM